MSQKNKKNLSNTKNKSINKENVENKSMQEFIYVPFKEEEGVDYALKMVNIHKSFNNGTIKANVGMNLYVKKNSIHAIIGENGAGKSTLMSILFGMHEQDINDVQFFKNVIYNR